MAIITNQRYDQASAQGLAESGVNLSDLKLIIYQGTIPADVSTWTEAGSAADELAQTTNSFTLANGGTQVVTFGTVPPPFNASATGTAAWYVIVRDDDASEYFMGEVSTIATGTGTLFVDSVSLTLGSPITISSLGIDFNGLG